MAIDSVADLITGLDQSRLLEPPQLAELNRKVQGRTLEPRVLAQKLIDSGWLTPYQVNSIFQGKIKELTLGPYVLLERVGEGGMGSVYKARHQKLKRVCALKVIRKEWLSQVEAVRRFQREIRAASALHHPNIVHSFDAGQLGETHYIAMEFVDGIDLARLVKSEGPLPVEQACDFVRQAALGLQHAHEKKLIHRDIKPGNLLLTRAGSQIFEGPWGTVKILDMGLARIPRPAESEDTTASGTLTQAGAVVGTPDYIAPEQARDSRTVDIRADIYSLGCTFFFLLTGQVPFPGGTGMEKLFKHQLDAPPPVEGLRPGLPAGVAEVVSRLLAKRPEDRYQEPAELARALEPFCAPAASPAAPVPQAQRVTRATHEGVTPSDPAVAPEPRRTALPRPRRPRWLWAVPVAALLVLGGLALVLTSLSGPSKTAEATGAGPGPAAPVKWSLDALRHADIPADDRLPGLPEDVVAVLGEQRLRTWGMAGLVAVSPDGRHIAAGNARSLRVWDATTGRQAAVLSGPSTAPWLQGLAFSPDGKLLTAYVHNEPLRTWEVASGKLVAARNLSADAGVTALAPDAGTAVVRDKAGAEPHFRLWDLVADRERADLGPSRGVGMFTYSANGRFLAAWKIGQGTPGMIHSEVAVWDVAAGKELHPFKVEKETVSAVMPSPDGRSVAFGVSGGRIEVWDATQGRKLFAHEPPAARAFARQTAFAPDGRTVLGVWQLYEAGFVRLWDAATGRETAALPAELSPLASAQFTPDGKALVLTGQDPRLVLWDLAAGKERFPPRPGGRFSATAAAFAPDGRHLIAAGYTGETGVRVSDLEEGKDRVLTTEPMVWGGVMAPDRKTVVTRGDDWLTVWDAAAGKELGRLQAVKNQMTNVAVAAAGTVLAVYTAGETGARLYDLPSLRARCALQGAAGPTLALVFSGDGRTLATANVNGKVQLWDAATGTPRAVTLATAAGPGRFFLALSHDGKWLAALSDTQLRVWDARTGEDRSPPAAATDPRPTHLLFAPADDRLVWANTKQAQVWDLARPGPPQALNPGGEAFASFLWSPDGKRLAAAAADGRLAVWDAAAPDREPRRISLPGPAAPASFAPDGRHLATANSNGTVYVVRVGP